MRQVMDGFRLSAGGRAINGTIIIESQHQNPLIGNHSINVLINGQPVHGMVLERAAPDYGIMLGNIITELMREMNHRFYGTPREVYTNNLLTTHRRDIDVDALALLTLLVLSE